MTEYNWPEAARNDKAFGERVVHDVNRLEQDIINATWLMQHTPDINAKIQYQRIIRSAAEDFNLYKDGYSQCENDFNKTIQKCYSLNNGRLRSYSIIKFQNMSCEDRGLYTPDLFWENVSFNNRKEKQ